MTAPRRVLNIATLYPNAHTPRFGTFVARSLEALAKQGRWQPVVINPIGLPPVLFGPYRALANAIGDSIDHGQTEHGVQIYRPRFTLIPRIGGPLNPWLITRAALPLIRRLHAETPFDLVDAQFFYPDGPVAAHIAQALGLPFSIKARGADIQFWGHQRWCGPQILRAGSMATGMLAVSQAIAGNMAELGLPHDKITIHYTGLDREKFRPHPRQEARMALAEQGILPPIPPEKSLLACVGALIPRKGQELVIHALASLPDCALALVGTGPDEAKLRDLVKELHLEERVFFLGSLDHQLLPIVLSAANAMVLPSASEGLANAWVEALACGTPIIISDAGGARELVPHDGAGRIVERNPPAIASAIQDLLAAPPSTEETCATVSAFSWECHARRLADYYDTLMRSGIGL